MATQASPRLPLWRTVAEAYVITYRNLGYLACISWVWVLVMFLIASAYHYMAFRIGWGLPSDPFDASSVGWQVDAVMSTLIYMPMLASIAVAWHRRLLAGETWQGRYYLRLDRTVASYFGLAFLISLIAIGPIYALPESLIIGNAWLPALLLAICLAIAFGLYISMRIWLVLPARALGRRDFALSQAWSGSSHNFWRMFIGCLLCNVPSVIVVIVSLPVDWTKAGQQPISDALWQAGVGLATTLVAGMPVISFLSLAYRRLIMAHDAQVVGSG
jgi:hypothetical protein